MSLSELLVTLVTNKHILYIYIIDNTHSFKNIQEKNSWIYLSNIFSTSLRTKLGHV
jgi:hypothetical protein